MAGWAMGPEAWAMMGVWVIVLVSVVWLLVHEPRRPGRRDDAMELLRARFARGELTEDEFNRAKRMLGE